MSDRAAVVEQVVAVATVETDRGPVAAVAVEQAPVATVVAEQGPAGPPGNDRVSVSRAPAAENLSGHRAIGGSSDGVSTRSASDLSTLGQVVGVTLGSAVRGQEVQFQTSGEIVEPSWSWMPGRVWLGENGLLTQTLPVQGYLQQIGTSNGPTKLVVNIGTPIQLG